MLRENKNEKAQVTIFIILALIIIVGIALIFLLIKRPAIGVEDVENPQAYIQSCTKDAVEEAVEILSEQGGDIEPEGSVLYQGKDITHLCYNANYYVPCINQRPMLVEHIEGEITDYIIPKINNCFNNLKTKLEEKNYGILMESNAEMQLTTQLQTRQVVVNINRDFKMTKRDKTQEFKNFKMSLVHPIYDLAEIAMEIANQEAKYCYFNVDGFNTNYLGFEIRKYMIDDSKIYKINEKASNQNFIFAIRGCVMPAGL